MKLLAKLRFYLHAANELPSNMSSNGTQEILKGKRGDMVPASLSTAQRKATEVALFSACVASLLTFAYYNVIKYLDRFPCLVDENFNMSTSADYSRMCAMGGVMRDTVPSLLFFSLSAILVNVLLSLKWVQTTPHVLLTWVTFMFLWAVVNVFATLVFILNFKDDTIFSMFALPSIAVTVLGAWTVHTVSHYKLQIEEQQEAIRMKNNEMRRNKCKELQKTEKCVDELHMFSKVPLQNIIDIHM